MHAGYVLLLSSKTKQWAADFKLNSTATAVSFSPDSRYVLASGADADVYKFDIRSRRCVLRFFNEVRAVAHALLRLDETVAMTLTCFPSGEIVHKEGQEQRRLLID